MELKICKKIATAERRVLRFAWSSWKFYCSRSASFKCLSCVDSASLKLLAVLHEIEALLSPENEREILIRANVDPERAQPSVRVLYAREDQRKLLSKCRKLKQTELKAMSRADFFSAQLRIQLNDINIMHALRRARKFYVCALIRNDLRKWHIYTLAQHSERVDSASTIYNRNILKKSFTALTINVSVFVRHRQRRFLHQWLRITYLIKLQYSEYMNRKSLKMFLSWKQIPKFDAQTHYMYMRVKRIFLFWKNDLHVLNELSDQLRLLL